MPVSKLSFSRRAWLAPLLSLALSCRAASAEGAAPPVPVAAMLTLPNLFAAALLVAFVIAAWTLRNALVASRWTLADALSEEANVTLCHNGEPIIQDGKAVVGWEMRASVSRFIALFGLVGVLIVYLGFGVVIVQRLAASQSLPSKDEFGELETFMFSGATLFAPYIVNKFASIFDWLKPKA